MNKARRNSISVIINELSGIKNRLESILSEEEMYYDNIPENLQGSERAEISEESIELLSEAIDNLEEVISL